MPRWAWVVVIILVGAGVVDFLLVAYGEMALGSCGPAPVFDVSVRGSGFAADLGPPYYKGEQFVLNPGSSALLTVTWTSTRENLTSDVSALTDPELLLDVTSGRMLTPLDSGISLSPVDIDATDDHHLTATLNVTASPSARGGTYSVFTTCRYEGPFLTAGALPYLGPILGVPQPVTLLLPFAVAGAGVAVILISVYLQRRGKTHFQ